MATTTLRQRLERLREKAVPATGTAWCRLFVGTDDDGCPYEVARHPSRASNDVHLYLPDNGRDPRPKQLNRAT